MASFEVQTEKKINLINDYIEESLLTFRSKLSKRFSPLLEAMQYSLEGGGKRLRPVLVLATAEYLGVPEEKVLPLAAALEFIHSYSLIHDDLPALDDDDFRRGKPSSHKQFGEAVAILTGDALLTEAFSQLTYLAQHGFEPSSVLNVIEFVSHQSGIRGMVGGQLLDVSTPEQDTSLPEVEFIHIHKTGALILASVLAPAKLIKADATTLERLKKYGENIGLAFQVSDDLLDAEFEERKNNAKSNVSYCAFMSPHETRQKLEALVGEARKVFEEEKEKAWYLLEIAKFIETRKR